MGLQGQGYTAISNYLVNTLLPGVSSLRSTNIYDYEKTDLGGFPAVTVTGSEIPGKVLDNARNQRIYRFVIRVFIDRKALNFGASKTESILRTISDGILASLDANPTLGGTCIYTSPAQPKFGYVDRESNDLRLAEIQLDCLDANTWR